MGKKYILVKHGIRKDIHIEDVLTALKKSEFSAISNVPTLVVNKTLHLHHKINSQFGLQRTFFFCKMFSEKNQ